MNQFSDLNPYEPPIIAELAHPEPATRVARKSYLPHAGLLLGILILAVAYYVLQFDRMLSAPIFLVGIPLTIFSAVFLLDRS